MKATFELLLNGKVSKTVFANKDTKEVYPASRNSFGYNAIFRIGDEFYNKYGKNLKTNQGKANCRIFYYSEKA